MILCVYCGNEMEDEATVCPSCGKEVELPEDQAALEQEAQEDIDSTESAPEDGLVAAEEASADEPAEDTAAPAEDETAPEPEVGEETQEAGAEPEASEGAEEVVKDTGDAEAAVTAEAEPAAAEEAQDAEETEIAPEDEQAKEEEPAEATEQEGESIGLEDAAAPDEGKTIDLDEGVVLDESETQETEEKTESPEEEVTDIEAAADMAIRLDEPIVPEKAAVEGGAKMSLARAAGALVCGIAGVFFCLVPIAGLVLSIVAMVLGAKARSHTVRQRRGMAIAGFVLGVVGLVVSIGALIWWIVILTSGAKVFWLLGSLV